MNHHREHHTNKGMHGSLSALRQRNRHACFLIGHITKDGTIAGPKLLEHMVDTVLQFEGDRHYAYRILRTLKTVLAAHLNWASTK